MAGNYTFTMIKPSTVKNGHEGKILSIIQDAGFRITAMKKIQMTLQQASLFYEVHQGKPFYPDLVEYMASGPVVAAVLEKPDAVESFRSLIGATDPSKAEKGTIRQVFGTSVRTNAIHGSDNDEHAAVERSFFFSGIEYY